MAVVYAPKRTKNLFDPSKPFKLSRSKVELFMRCKRCFYQDRRLGITPPPGFPFTLNSAVDALLKREFDFYRSKQKPHPLMKKYGIKAVPYAHPKLETWRDSLHAGVSYHHPDTNLTLTGGVDDVWVDNDGWLNVVDYKATSKRGEVTLDQDWQVGYKRQMEVYQWLFRRNDFKVADKGYFVYCNGDSERSEFASTLHFAMTIIPHIGNDIWVEDVLFDIRACLESDALPAPAVDCHLCGYYSALSNSLAEFK
jgi:hypothetical protein